MTDAELEEAERIALHSFGLAITASQDDRDAYRAMHRMFPRLIAAVREARRERDARPLSLTDVVDALAQGRIERKCAEGDHAWVSLVDENRRLRKERDDASALVHAEDRPVRTELRLTKHERDALRRQLADTESRTAEAIAAWLENGPDISSPDAMMNMTAAIRAGEWRP